MEILAGFEVRLGWSNRPLTHGKPSRGCDAVDMPRSVVARYRWEGCTAATLVYRPTEVVLQPRTFMDVVAYCSDNYFVNTTEVVVAIDEPSRALAQGFLSTHDPCP